MCAFLFSEGTGKQAPENQVGYAHAASSIILPNLAKGKACMNYMRRRGRSKMQSHPGCVDRILMMAILKFCASILSRTAAFDAVCSERVTHIYSTIIPSLDQRSEMA